MSFLDQFDLSGLDTSNIDTSQTGNLGNINNSPTPNTGGGNIFSDILGGVGQSLRTAIPQFTTTFLNNAVGDLNNPTYRGGTKTPTTAQSQSNANIFSSPKTWLVIGGVVAGGVALFYLLRK